jgi:hypothetical protein
MIGFKLRDFVEACSNIKNGIVIDTERRKIIIEPKEKHQAAIDQIQHNSTTHLHTHTQQKFKEPWVAGYQSIKMKNHRSKPTRRRP